jgi:hypothetical protein
MPRMSQQPQRDKETVIENNENVNVETQTNEDSQGNIKWDRLKNIYSFVVHYFKWVYFISKVYILWIVIHYISVQLYVQHCVPSSIWGFITSPILVSSPHCKAMRWVLHTGANTIDNMWNTIGVWFSVKLLEIN